MMPLSLFDTLDAAAAATPDAAVTPPLMLPPAFDAITLMLLPPLTLRHAAGYAP